MVKKKQEVSLIRSSAAEYLTFVAATGSAETSVEMRYENENIWLTQKMMAVLYDLDVRTINEHLQKIFADGELEQDEAFMKLVKIYKMTKTLANIKIKMKADGIYEPKWIDLFAEDKDVKATASYN
jgi:uncharacterized membrane protein